MVRAVAPAPPPLLALPAPPAAAQQGRAEGNQRRLTPEEMAERRRQGLCFNCNEKYSRGHNRFCRRIFFMDGVEIDDVDRGAADQEDDAAAETPVFSLHAVAGVAVGAPILLRVTLGAATLVALVDTGSTHNFIGEAAAHRTGLAILPRPRLTATVANGEKVACPGVLRHAPISIEGMTFDVDLYVMPLAGYDMVLGTQWMATLGRIAWDVATHTLSFHHGGRPICWSGVACTTAPTVHAATTREHAESTGEPLLEGLLNLLGTFSLPRWLSPPTRP